MDALVQLYGPFDEDNDSLPHFDDDGMPVPGDNATRLSAQLQIASSEGCCERLGSGISSLVTPGRYVLLIFHCSIGTNEERPYKVTYNLYSDDRIPSLPLQNAISYYPPGWGRTMNLLYRVTVGNTDDALVTRLGDIYRFTVATDDARTQEQVRVSVFTYAQEEIPKLFGVEPPKEKKKDENNVAYKVGYWGKSSVTFEPPENQVVFDSSIYDPVKLIIHLQVLFVRVSILNGYRRTSIKSSLTRIQG